ncbi:MAG: leucine-rich repeat protein [Lachnospiraceae bacterium]|nr:leucine-rich repeat protein [Lachnospiraceae bacterium]
MKKLFLRALLLLLAVIAVPLALFVTAFTIPPQFEETYYGELPAMFDHLRDAKGKKIILVGSSGLAFGVDYALLAKQFPDYTLCPFGLYGTIGTKTMMDLSKVHISEGDLVILAPEQGAQTFSMYFNGEEVYLATDGRPDILRYIPADEWASMAEALPAFLSRKFRCFTVDGAPVPSGIYARSSFDETCNLIYDRPQNILEGGYNPYDPVSYSTAIVEPAFLDYVNEYNDWILKQGATLLLAFPPVNVRSIEGGPEGVQVAGEDSKEGLFVSDVQGLQGSPLTGEIQAFQRFLEENVTCPLLGDPLSSVMDAEWFYDSNIHLNTAGSKVYTKHLAEAIKTWMGDPSPVSIEIPEKPALPGQPSADETDGTEENADAACFTYLETEDGLMINGLTAEGKTRTTLTLPLKANGKRVTGFLPETFAGDTVIEEIHLQENIRSMENGSFKGCTSLRAVYLAPGKDPSHCQIPPGGGLTLGADAMYFYVENERLSDYIYNYFWSAYSSRIKGYEAEENASPEETETVAESEASANETQEEAETNPDETFDVPKETEGSTEETSETVEESQTSPEEQPGLPEDPGSVPEIGEDEALIRYDLNGGVLAQDSQLGDAITANKHLGAAVSRNDAPGATPGSYVDIRYSVKPYPRANTAVPAGTLTKDGYTLVGWNTAADGSGTHIGIGSRVTLTPGAMQTLYAQWLPWSSSEDFTFVLIDPEDLPKLFANAPKKADLEDLVKQAGAAIITSYTGADAEVVIPASLGGYPVIGVAEGAFLTSPLTSLVFPDTIKWVANGICKECENLSEITLYDNITRFEKDAFGFHVVPKTIHLNAYLPPVYGLTERGQFASKIDLLRLLNPDKPKMVIFGGCSAWYGVDTTILAQYYRQYELINMGVIGGLDAQFQLDLIEPSLKEGDVFVHVPELTEYQLFCSDHVDNRFFEMMEGNYDLLAELDAQKYGFLLEAFRDYLLAKQNLLDNHIAESTEYCLMSVMMDVHGNLVTMRGPNYEAGSDPFTPIDPKDLTTEALIQAYRGLTEKGIKLCWACSPIEEESADLATLTDIQTTVLSAVKDADIPLTVVLECQDALLPAWCFYDTSYHCNTEGMSIYTSNLLSRMPRN